MTYKLDINFETKNRVDSSITNMFYRSKEWKEFSKQFKKKFNKGYCMTCRVNFNETKKYYSDIQKFKLRPDKIRFRFACVDHIKPLRDYWNLRYDILNLQILCNKCNFKKGNW